MTILVVVSLCVCDFPLCFALQDLWRNGRMLYTSQSQENAFQGFCCAKWVELKLTFWILHWLYGRKYVHFVELLISLLSRLKTRVVKNSLNWLTSIIFHALIMFSEWKWIGFWPDALTSMIQMRLHSGWKAEYLSAFKYSLRTHLFTWNLWFVACLIVLLDPEWFVLA